jgi:hypothetical protein
MLVSDSPKPMDFTLAVRSSLGQMLTTSETIQPGAKRSFDLASLITQLGGDPTGAYAEGSVAVYFVGTIMPIVGQISIRNPQRSLAHESEMVENDPGRSDVPAVLNGLWWGLGGGREAQVMITNTSGNPVIAEAYLDFQGKRHALLNPLTFIPYETKVLSINQLLLSLGVDPAQAPEGGITIIQAGAHPALIANGKITDPATGFSSTIDFPLPELEQASALHASGLPLGVPTKDSPFAGMGNFTPHVIVRNLLGTPQNVTVTVEYPQPAPPVGADSSASASQTNSEPESTAKPGRIISRPPLPGDKDHHPEWGAGTGTTAGSIRVASLPVGPYGTVDYSLAAALNELPLPLPFCSIRIQYSGAPGSMEAEVSSVEARSDLVVDARVENEGNGWAGSGANPWHLDQNTESILFLTNESNQPARIGFQVTTQGIHYYLTQLKLQPHETRAINIRLLRDAQLADFRKSKIPAAATDGSVSWIRLDNVPVMGRLLVITRHAGMSSSYDCCTCPCPPSDSYIEVDPPSINLLPGWATQLSAYDYKVNCNGQYFSYDWTDGVNWSSSNSGVATVNSRGYVTASSTGSAKINASTIGLTYTWTQFEGCYSTGISLQNSGTANVQSPQFVKVIYSQCGTHTCPSGYNNTLENYIPYQVLDVNQNPIPIAGLTVQEYFSNIISSCYLNGQPVEPTPSNTTTDSTGSFSDHVWLCCQPSWSCGASFNQTFTIDGYPVFILANGLTGTHNVIQTMCSNGQGTCPQDCPSP